MRPSRAKSSHRCERLVLTTVCATQLIFGIALKIVLMVARRFGVYEGRLGDDALPCGHTDWGASESGVTTARCAVEAPPLAGFGGCPRWQFPRASRDGSRQFVGGGWALRGVLG